MTGRSGKRAYRCLGSAVGGCIISRRTLVGLCLVLSTAGFLSAACASSSPLPGSSASPAEAPATALPHAAITVAVPSRTPTSPPSPSPTPFPLPVSTATPSLAVTPSPSRSPATATAVAAEAELSRVQAAREAVGTDLRGRPDARDRLVALAEAVSRYLRVVPDAAWPRTVQPALADALRQGLTSSGQRDPLSGRPAEAVVAVATFGSHRVVAMSLGVPGAPALAFVDEGMGFRAYALSATARQPGADLQPIEGFATVERVEDVNGDGQQEVVVVETVLGASATPVHVGILQWSNAERLFHSLFAGVVSNWAGPASWRLLPRDGKQDIVLEAPLFGPFDHKLLPHQQETRVYRWDGWSYTLAERQATPPQYQRQQANVGEAAFRRGACEEAITAYRQVIENKALKPDEGESPDWVGFAWFRIGECSALLGREADARAALERAQASGPDLDGLASRLLAVYQTDGAARALASLLETDLPRRMYEGRSGNLAFPLDAVGVLYPGAALAAFVQSHPEALQRSDEGLVATLRAHGLPVAQALVVDPSGEGRVGLVAMVRVGDDDTIWVVHAVDGRWVGRLISRVAPSGARLEGPLTVIVEGKPRQAFAVVRNSHSRTLYTMNRQTVLQIFPGTPGGSPQVLVPMDAGEFAWEFHLE